MNSYVTILSSWALINTSYLREIISPDKNILFLRNYVIPDVFVHVCFVPHKCWSSEENHQEYPGGKIVI